MGTYGERVRAARKGQRRTLTDLAASLGIHKSYLCDIELGRRTPGPAVARAVWVATGVRFETGREEDLRLALVRLVRVGGEFSANMAGPWWEELCGALSQARAALTAD